MNYKICYIKKCITDLGYLYDKIKLGPIILLEALKILLYVKFVVELLKMLS